MSSLSSIVGFESWLQNHKNPTSLINNFKATESFLKDKQLCCNLFSESAQSVESILLGIETQPLSYFSEDTKTYFWGNPAENEKNRIIASLRLFIKYLDSKESTESNQVKDNLSSPKLSKNKPVFNEILSITEDSLSISLDDLDFDEGINSEREENDCESLHDEPRQIASSFLENEKIHLPYDDQSDAKEKEIVPITFNNGPTCDVTSLLADKNVSYYFDGRNSRLYVFGGNEIRETISRLRSMGLHFYYRPFGICHFTADAVWYSDITVPLPEYCDCKRETAYTSDPIQKPIIDSPNPDSNMQKAEDSERCLSFYSKYGKLNDYRLRDISLSSFRYEQCLFSQKVGSKPLNEAITLLFETNIRTLDQLFSSSIQSLHLIPGLEGYIHILDSFCKEIASNRDNDKVIQVIPLCDVFQLDTDDDDFEQVVSLYAKRNTVLKAISSEDIQKWIHTSISMLFQTRTIGLKYLRALIEICTKVKEYYLSSLPKRCHLIDIYLKQHGIPVAKAFEIIPSFDYDNWKILKQTSLPICTRQALHNAGLESISDLLNMDSSLFFTIKGFGKASIRRLKDFCIEFAQEESKHEAFRICFSYQ